MTARGLITLMTHGRHILSKIRCGNRKVEDHSKDADVPIIDDPTKPSGPSTAPGAFFRSLQVGRALKLEIVGIGSTLQVKLTSQPLGNR